VSPIEQAIAVLHLRSECLSNATSIACATGDADVDASQLTAMAQKLFEWVMCGPQFSEKDVIENVRDAMERARRNTGEPPNWA
jgi:hypothetical protein